ncbi:MAG: S8 family serine peptidase [Anaerolineales bacterium]|jgi:subtilisin family serine protease|nr:S8 family serine peptidase [Anaerolineales bacterium]
MKKKVFLMLLLIVSMLFSAMQFAPVAAASQPSDRIPPESVSLDEVVEYYGRLGDIEGPVGVVVELASTPAALSYAQAKEKSLSPQALASVTKTQVSLVRNEQDKFASALKSKDIKVNELFRTQRIYNGIWLYVDASQVAQLAKMPGVKALHPMVPKEIEHTTSVPLVGALQAWAGSGQYQGENVSIGIIDTGIDYIHTNFGGLATYAGQDFTTLDEVGNLFPTAKVVGGWDFAGDDYDAGGAGSALVPVPDPDPMDCGGHGSHVSGSAAGFGVLPDGSTFTESLGDSYADLAALSADDYITKFRIGPGVAPKADLYALRVFGCEGSTNLTEQGIEWAMDPNQDDNFDDHLDIINMSLGSSFGSEADTSAAASNNAAAAGIIVVASAGNSADVYYITGAPGVARRAISVANSVDSGAVVSAFELVSTSGTMSPGTYFAVEAAFGPTTFDQSGELVLAIDSDGITDPPNDGCQAIINDVSGKIALMDRGTCSFYIKYDNAVAAGAAGVLVANNAPGLPLAMGGDPTGAVTAPAMMTTLSIGNALKADLSAGTVTVRLTTDYENQFVATDPALEDTLASSSSRGIARTTNYLKPDIAAPGDTIFSTANGTGDKGVSFGGTSMASPHVAGAMALLREQHPSWTVAELKALVMNTATQDIMQGANPSTPSRVGAGRMEIANAITSEVIAYNAANPEMVSVPFGAVKVVNTVSGIDQTLTQPITIENKGAVAETYNLSFVLRYAANPGITFSLVDGSDNPLSSVTVPGGGTQSVTVKVELDAALLGKTLDPTVLTTGGRSRMGESGGLVLLTSTGSAPTLRIPVHIAARAASEMGVAEASLLLPAASSGIATLTPSGTAVNLTSDFSIAYILELLGESPADPLWSVSPAASADLQYVGAMSNYPTQTWDDSSVYFGFSTYAPWDTLYSTEFDIYIDIDEDGVDDYVVYNSSTGGATPNDVFITRVFDLNAGTGTISSYVNDYSGGLNTNVFNNNVVVLPVGLPLLGLDKTTNTDFDFYVVTFHRDAPDYVDLSDVYSYDTANKAFDTNNAYGYPDWKDDSAVSASFDIAYNKAYMTADTQGLLILHTHNAVNTAEVIPAVDPTEFGKTSPADIATGQLLSPTLSWEASDGATSYEYCYSSAPGPCSAWHSVGTNTSVILNDLAAGYTYYWQVRAVNLGGTTEANRGNWWSFSTTDTSACTWPAYTAPASATFGDVPMSAGHWSWVERLSNATITAGCGAGNFCPFSDVNRAQMAIFLLRAKHCGSSYTPPAIVGSPHFNDVPVAASYAAWVEQLYNEGITTGCGGGNFCPLQNVNRAEMAIFVLRARHGATYSPPAVVTSTGFDDVSVAVSYAPWVVQLAAEGISAGCGGGNFCPLQSVNRAQMSIFLVRAFELP